MAQQSDRRKFLLGAGAAVAASSLGAAQAREIRTAFVGVGQRGNGVLDRVLQVSNVRITAICDIDPVARDGALSKTRRDNPSSFTEWRRVLDFKDVDAVVIATPCDLHAEMASAFLEANKYVYLEKPLAITPEQVQQVVNAAKRSKAFLQIGQQLRYYPNMREAIRQIHEGGLLGTSYIIKAHRHGGRGRPSGQPSQQTPQQKVRSAWYADVKRSGDLIVENGVHNIDACNWIANSRPVSAYGHGKKYFPKPIPPGTVMMDGYSVKYIYENDVHCDYSQISFHSRTMKELPSGMWYSVFGEKGSAWLTHSSATFHDIYGEGEPRNMLAGTREKFDPNLLAMEDFYGSIREKRQPFANLEVAAVAAVTAIMGREAIYRRRSVTWKELGVTL